MTDQLQELTPEQERDEAHQALAAVVGWIGRYGVLHDHKEHRRTRAGGCAECIVLNDAIACLDKIAGAANRRARVLAERAKEGTKIIVNGREARVTASKLTFNDVVRLAGGPNYDTVTYRWTTATIHGDMHKNGILMREQTVDVHEGMIFNCANTSNA